MNKTMEQELVLELSQFRDPNQERILHLIQQRLDWAVVLGHLIYNRTAGIAYHVLRKCNAPQFNREFEMGLYLIHEMQSQRTMSHKRSIMKIAEVMKESGIPHAFLKGSILANSIYPMGCRISSDIDILLRAEDLTSCGKVLKDLGFIQGFYDENTKVIKPASRREILNYRMNYGEIVPYQKAVDEPGINLIEVDINFSLDWMAQGTEKAVDNFIQEAEDYDFDGVQKISSLPKEYFLAHLCVHLFKEAAVMNWVEWQRDLGLYKFVDIYGFLTDPSMNLNWDKFIHIMEINNIKDECYYALDYTRTFFPVVNEDVSFIGMMNQIKPQNTDYLDQVVDASDESIVYQWKKDLISRFFDMKRFKSLERVASHL
ncbi:nucleotidyltransferase family protein [Chengkuizengella axinellae]|uniref:Nucleotidyltransferase family protein n=1 Tax=Chengkuizengella axinellae TaxID=3064388 RepID=A0ABT9IZ01_9BACL|nr:nucleotidyltransferase family protein [Chengkuizengella sp. 2205SS18-9]MDP5274596.1 nucleotidyltransferase family protein [Chengkuizengella sp. 2205SS18-9]